MKKCLKSIVLVFMILMLMMVFVACDNPILCKIKFDSNGGSSVNSISTMSGKKIVMPNAPTRDGYTFDGWFRDNGVWEKPFTENSLLNTSISENFTVYAKWEKVVSPETNFTFELSENNAIITGLKDKTATEVIIPSKVTISNVEYNVTSIGNRAFYNCSNLSSITLSSSVTSIGNEAFRDCDSLSSIALSSSVTSIGSEAFYNCNSLSNITLPSSVISIGDRAFNSSTIIFTDALTKPDGWNFEADYYGCDLNTFATINGISYVVKSGNAIAASCKRSLETAIIPSKVTINNVEYNVTSIGNRAFYDCSSLSSITLPSSLTTIGNKAFQYCRNLSSITLPSSVISIGRDAFEWSTILFTDALTKPDGWSCEADYYGCDLNTFITINEISYVVKNGNAIIARCVRSLETAIIPSKVTINNVEYNITSIGYLAFYDCDGLKSITLPNSVTSIGDRAFYNCNNLSSITLPSSVISIGGRAFDSYTIIFTDALTKPDDWSCEADYYGCDLNTFATINGISYVVKNGNAIAASCKRSLETAIIPSKVTINNVEYNVTSIGNRAFYDCSSLSSITLPRSVTSIGDYAFYSCNSLSSITLPNSVTSIGNRAFYDCSNLSSIILPSSVISIGRDAFVRSTIIFTDALTKQDGWSCEADYYGCDLNTIATINGISYVVKNGNAIAARCERSLETVIIPSKVTINNVEYNVTSIGNRAFYECDSLSSITLSSSVISIGEEAFYKCSNLSSITLPSSVTSIGDSTFYGCHSLSSITLPNSLTTIGNGAFYECSSLSSITLPSSVTSIGDSTFYECYSLSSITLPSSVISIGEEAFYNCSSLSSITLPSSVTSIGNGAFSYCSSLSSITLPSGVTSIGNRAFYECDNLSSITLPNSVISIGDYAFMDCSSLSSITLPSSVISIGDYAFGWSKIIIFTDALTKPDGWSCEADYYGCDLNTFATINEISYVVKNGNAIAASCAKSLETAIIPSKVTINNVEYNVTSIGNWAFYGCANLTTITLPNSLTTIGDYAFYDCSSLSSITLPSSVTSIGNGAFSGCSSLSSITLPSSVISIGEEAFYNCSNLISITLPSSVISIGNYAFYKCSSLTIYCEALSQPDSWSVDWNYDNCPVVWGHK